MRSPRLITISFSHFCDKARWALEHAGIPYQEEAHLPGFHVRAVRRARGRRSTPVLVTKDRVLADSSDILAWAHAERPSAGLYGGSAEERADIEALEDLLDQQLGPHSRRWAYFHLLPNRALALAMFAAQTNTPAYERALVRVLFPALRTLMQRSMRIDADGAERSRLKVDAVFETIGARIADGRRFLVGDALSAADITLVTLASPVLLWDHPGSRLPSMEALPAAAAAQVRTWRAHPVGVFTQRLLSERGPPSRS